MYNGNIQIERWGIDDIYNQHIRLENGVQMPIFGLGVYKMTNPEETFEAITHGT